MKKKKIQVWERDNYMCYYCGVKCKRGGAGGFQYPNTATVDHVYPESKGGSKEISNLVTACFECNNKKADRVKGPTIVKADYELYKTQ